MYLLRPTNDIGYRKKSPQSRASMEQRRRTSLCARVEVCICNWHLSFCDVRVYLIHLNVTFYLSVNEGLVSGTFVRLYLTFPPSQFRPWFSAFHGCLFARGLPSFQRTFRPL